MGMVAIIVAAPFTSAASDVALTLAQSKEIAFRRNWDLLAAKSDIDGATAQQIVAHEFPNPTLALSTSDIPIDGTTAGTRSGNGLWQRSYDTVFAINQLFEVGGKRSSRQASARAGLEAAKQRFADARRTLEEAVAKAYIGALAAEANRKILGESAVSLRNEAQIAAARFKAGDISQADETRLAVAAERLDVEAREAETAAVAARIALETLLAFDRPDGTLVLVDSLEQLAAENAPTEAAGRVEGRSDVLAAEASVDKATADLDLQRAFAIPDPTISTQYEHEPPDRPNTIGLGVSLPLPLWNWNRGAILAALSDRARAEIELAKIRTQAAADVAIARLDYHEAALRWQRQSGEIQPKSARIVETVEFAYKRGAASLVDLLAAERDDNDVRLATVKAAADMATALASLRSALGIADARLRQR